MPVPNEVEINNVWASRTAEGEPETMTLPSGQVVKARKIGLQKLIEAGVMSEADSLTQLIGTKHFNEKPAEVMQMALANPKAFGSLVMMIDRALPIIVVEPDVRLHVKIRESGETVLIPVEHRESGMVYTDQIDLQDKIFLLNYAVGDLQQLAPFRGQAGDDVATVADGSDVPRAPKRTARDKPKRRR